MKKILSKEKELPITLASLSIILAAIHFYQRSYESNQYTK